ncbi:transcriptional regulator [Kitasatospora sp. MMS16-BH015]|uniref:MerR family transcriptional regulator n=1 Tax=Kitasatospora sp. MMS16-BH015 TaxID=2018025 RepID=UPI000CA0AA3C|nr:MerR family transcriptional regulator [Kitasatospora sp. MMS16-BH015]AUG82191.1 transcriptional regulator [Kitasatospora sp. MMS16-BH015]
MRLAELSERSGVSPATIKYYLREQLLQPGALVSTRQAEYGEEHLRRLRLIRALIQIGRMPVATAREVITALQNEELDQNSRLGLAMGALPPGPEPAADDPDVARAEVELQLLVGQLGWHKEALPPSAYRNLLAALATLARLGYPHDLAHLLPYARAAVRLAEHDLDSLDPYDSPLEKVEAAVALTVLYEPVLLSLRRLAQAQESHRRFGSADPGICDV